MVASTDDVTHARLHNDVMRFLPVLVALVAFCILACQSPPVPDVSDALVSCVQAPSIDGVVGVRCDDQLVIVAFSAVLTASMDTVVASMPRTKARKTRASIGGEIVPAYWLVQRTDDDSLLEGFLVARRGVVALCLAASDGHPARAERCVRVLDAVTVRGPALLTEAVAASASLPAVLVHGHTTPDCKDISDDEPHPVVQCADRAFTEHWALPVPEVALRAQVADVESDLAANGPTSTSWHTCTIHGQKGPCARVSAQDDGEEWEVDVGLVRTRSGMRSVACGRTPWAPLSPLCAQLAFSIEGVTLVRTHDIKPQF